MFFLFIFSSLPFDLSWCEPPGIPDQVPQDSDLIQVQLITRHGARTPLHLFPNFDYKWQCNETETQLYSFNENMHIHVKKIE